MRSLTAGSSTRYQRVTGRPSALRQGAAGCGFGADDVLGQPSGCAGPGETPARYGLVGVLLDGLACC